MWAAIVWDDEDRDVLRCVYGPFRSEVAVERWANGESVENVEAIELEPID